MTRNQTQIKAAIDFIRTYGSFLVAAHLNPEGDAIGASLAMARLLETMDKRAVIFNRDPVPKNCAFLPGADSIRHDLEGESGVQAVIVLDSGELDRTGRDFARFAEGRPILNIDHHQTNTRFGKVNWVDAEASSAGELIAALWKALELPVSPEAALCIYAAIATDTGSFQYSNTSPEALRAAADMVENGARPEHAALNYYHAKPASHLILLARCLATLEFNEGQTRGDAFITRETFRETGTGAEAAEGIVNLISDVETVEVAAIFRETEDGWKASLRGKGKVDVASIAERYGGGGHKNAAGLRLKGGLEEARAQLRREIDQALAAIPKGK